jgi:hypothetical protein
MKQLNEVARMQQLAGIKEIKVNPPRISSIHDWINSIYSKSIPRNVRGDWFAVDILPYIKNIVYKTSEYYSYFEINKERISKMEIIKRGNSPLKIFGTFNGNLDGVITQLSFENLKYPPIEWDLGIVGMHVTGGFVGERPNDTKLYIDDSSVFRDNEEDDDEEGTY